MKTKKQQRKQKAKSISKKREKEKQLETQKSSSNQKKTESQLAKSPLSVFDKLFAFGGLLLGGILVNAFEGIKKKAEEFYNDNKELFDTIGGFLTGVKDSVIELFNSFTGPASEEGSYDWLAKFDDSGKLLPPPKGGILSQIEYAFDGLADMINGIDKAVGGKGDIANFLYSDKGQVLAKQDGKEGIYDKNTEKFYEKPFTEEERIRYQSQGSSSYQSAQTPDQAATSPPINDTSSSNRNDDHSVNTPQGGGNYPGFNPGTNPKKIYFHWSGGIGYNGRPAPYHSFVDGSGKVHYNQGYDKDRNSPGHTWRRNTGSVAIAANAMGHIGQENGYIERKGWAQTPLKSIQVNSMTLEAAKLALAWGWKESDINMKNIMTHAEAAANRDGLAPTPNYGPGGQAPIRWDLWYLKQGGAKWSGGEIMRNMIKQHMRNLNRQANAGSSTQNVSAITPAESRGNEIASAINQPDPGEDDEQTVLLQRVNITRYVPVPVTT